MQKITSKNDCLPKLVLFDVSAGQNTILTEPKERVNYNVRPYEGIYFHIIFTFYGVTVSDYLFFCKKNADNWWTTCIQAIGLNCE